ncbi:MAG TPA: 3-hydroxyacyl-CoA dehydrogenase NAD-binding domain-containing protein [Herpetosiphonaceae bacterium]
MFGDCEYHFFNPVPLMSLVEIVRGLLTSDATYGTIEALVKDLGKTRGFYTYG